MSSTYREARTRRQHRAALAATMTHHGPARTATRHDVVDDRSPTQPLAVGRHRAGLVLDDRPIRAPGAADRRPTPAHHVAALVAALVAASVVGAAAGGALGVPSPTVVAPAPATPEVHDVPPPPPLRSDGRVGEADGAVPDGGVSVDADVPAVARLDPDLLAAVRRAAADADRAGVALSVTGGWRSPEHQEQLLRDAVAEHGSPEEAARWVATAETSLHVSGDAVDVGPAGAAAWLAANGAGYGLCPVYRNEPWHVELRPGAVDDGCPPLYADPTHDPRMQQ